MSIITVGIDLAKNVFAVHGVDDNGKSVLVKPKVPRDKLLELVAQLPPCVIGMEACSGAHHWARQFRQYGHTVRLMAPKFVSPYRMSGKRGKNDAADAAAICEAVTRPQMRFVPVKEEHQQVILCLHRTRQGFVEERTATYNRLRGLISEFGIVLPQKVACLRREIGAHLEDLPGYANQCIGDLLAHADELDLRIDEYDRISRGLARQVGLPIECSSAGTAAHGSQHDRQQRSVEWVVYAKRPFAGPAAVLAYLSRYTHRVAISNRRLVALDERGVTFRWKDYRAKGKTRHKTMTLATEEFMRRFLLHVLPGGFHRIRHFGLIANAGRQENLARARKLLGVETPNVDATLLATDASGNLVQPTFVCPCRGAAMTVIETLMRGQPIRAPPPQRVAA